ncbi:sigma-70 family RNA polymerase sigma factor [Phyllobacterium chamaecytisi]|uniref:sigma-70 family RNA polymerase sigma factor n=1 Tax=Phyllobacterium chamaecytisi TaxID=2876082 RepID=UPI001CCF8320|nr:sigma-70 family RNA polymerase sigma factor [Phyllobacterium sp. KW56]MBZ9605246.1 sigma-70 family RNA polymerase sigma factor [Phyllobacterium sp. KW56]
MVAIDPVYQDYQLEVNCRAELVTLVPALRAFARSFYRQPDDADDLVQETLKRALGSLHQFTPGTSMKSWLFTIMRNTFNTAIKHQLREVTGGEKDIAENGPSRPPSQEWTIRGHELETALHQLDPDFRQAIMLVCVMGASYDEAAEICDCPIGTIKSRINRAKTHLLEMLGEKSREEILEAPQHSGWHHASHRRH